VGFGNSVADGHCGTVLAAVGEAVWSGLVVCLVECAIDGTVLAALGEAVWSGLVVGSVECAIDGTVVCVLDDALFLFFFLLLEVDFIDMLGTVEVSAVVGNMV
jgi:hypothetical protein